MNAERETLIARLTQRAVSIRGVIAHRSDDGFIKMSKAWAQEQADTLDDASVALREPTERTAPCSDSPDTAGSASGATAGSPPPPAITAGAASAVAPSVVDTTSASLACCRYPTSARLHNDAGVFNYYHAPAYATPRPSVEADLLAGEMALGATASEAYDAIRRRLDAALAAVP